MGRRIAFLRLLFGLMLFPVSSMLWGASCVDVFPDGDTGLTGVTLTVPTWSTTTNLIETSGSDSFASGDHYFNAGQLSGQYAIESTGVTARLYFTSLTISGQVGININGNPEDLIIVVNGPITIAGTPEINAIIYSTSTVGVSGNIDFDGSLSAEGAITLGGSNTVNYDSSAIQDADYGSLCTNSPVPVAYWSFNNNVGYIVPDESGNGHDGTLGANNSGEGDEPVGQCGFYLEYDGSDDYVNVSDHAQLDISQELTVAVWIRPEKIPSSGLMTILSKDENYEFHVNSSGQINWWWRTSSGNTRQFNSTISVATNVWVHVAIVYSKSAGTQTIYLDGVARGTRSYSEDLMNNSDDLQIGNDQGYSGRYFLGDIDEVYVYNSALTQVEIQQLMATSTSFCGLDDSLANYIFDGETWNGTTGEVSDGSGNGANATAMNGALTKGGSPAISGSPGTCQYGEFDGQNDYLVTENSSSDLQLSGDYSTGVWVNGSAVVDQKSWAGIYARTDTSGNNNHWNLQRDNNNDRLIIWHNNVSWNTGITLTNVSNGWHHIGIIYSGTTITSYLDGAQISSAIFSTAPATGNGHLNIGVDRTQSSSFVWNGLIDELFIFDKAISAANMAALYTQTRPCPATPSCVIDYQDTFSSVQYDNSDGASDWVNQWIEVDDNDSANNGVIRVKSGELRVEGWWGWWWSQVEIYRSVDLSNAISAQLSFDVRETGAESNDNFWVHAYNGSSWTLLDTFTGTLGNAGQSVSYDLTPYLNADTRIRFSGDGNSSNDRFFVDDVVISGNCASGIDHLEISAVTTGSTCNALAVTVRACEDAAIPCSTLVADYAENINLTINTTRGDWVDNTVVNSVVNGTSDDGAATYQFHDNDNGDAIFDLNYSYADEITITANDSANGLSTSSSVITFSDNAFVFNWTDSIHPGASGTDATVAVAGRNHRLTVSYVEKDSATGICDVVTGYDGADKSVRVWFDEAAGVFSGNQTPPRLIDVGDGDNISLPEGEPAPGSNFTLDFSLGVAMLNLGTSDVGEFTLSMADDSTAAVTISGESSLATIRPFGFAVDVGGDCTSTARQVNIAIDQNDDGFIAAGLEFPLSVKAVLWNAADDSGTYGDGVPDDYSTLYNNSCLASFGSEVTAQTTSLALSGTFLPAAIDGGVQGNLSPNGISGFTAGFASQNVRYSEVGIVNIDVTLQNYLGSSGNVNGQLYNLGRFYPYEFSVSAGSVDLGDGPDGSWLCDFTYQDQDFRFDQPIVLTLTALNADGDTTTNYEGDYWMLSAPAATSQTANNGVLGNDPSLGVTTSSEPVTLDISPVNGMGDGLGKLSFEGLKMRYIKGVTPDAADAPFAAEIEWSLPAVNLTDDDSACYRDGDGLDDCDDFAISGIDNGLPNENIRYGRVTIGNNNGSELMPLALPVQIEYWKEVAASGQYSFQVNVDDTCSDDSWAVGDVTLSNYQGKLGAGETTKTLGAFAAGIGTINLSAPGAGNEGSVNVMLGVDNWLKYNFFGSGNVNPVGVGSFGIYSGREPIFYLRESYR